MHPRTPIGTHMSRVAQATAQAREHVNRAHRKHQHLHQQQQANTALRPVVPHGGHASRGNP